METKSILLSKTFWFNLIVGLLTFVTYIDPSLLQSLGLAPEIQAQVLKIVGIVTVLGNLLLRAFTNKGVTISASSVTPVVLMLVVFSLSGCSFTQKAQSYLEKHCPKTYATNPLTGNLEIHYQCDSLWHSKQLSDKCGQVNICIDAVNGSVTGDVECIGLVNVPKLIGAAKKK